MNVRSAGFLLCLSVAALADKRPDPVGSCTKKPSDFLDYVKVQRTSGVPFDGAHEFSHCSWAVSEGLRLLAPTDGAVPIYAENVVLTLGVMGRTEAIPGLVSFLEDTRPSGGGGLSYAAYMAKVNVPVALGCLLNQISLDLDGRSRPSVNRVPQESLRSARKQILEYLVLALMDSSAWNRRIRWTSPYDASDLDRDLYLVKKSMQGLGLSGDISAECVLKFTRDHIATTDRSDAMRQFLSCGLSLPSAATARHWGHEHITHIDREQLQALAGEAVKTCAQVRSYPRGLADYYSESSTSSEHR